MHTTRIPNLDRLPKASPLRLRLADAGTRMRPKVLRYIAAVAAASAVSAQAGNYEIVPRFSALSLAGSGTVAGTGSVDFTLPGIGKGNGSFDIAGGLVFVPATTTMASIPVGGRLEASRQGSAWSVTLASVVPSGLEDAGITSPAWDGALQGDGAIHNVDFSDSLFALFSQYLRDNIALNLPFSASSLLVSFGGTAPLGRDGTFDMARLNASVSGELDIDGSSTVWSAGATPLQSGDGWVGGRDDGTILLSFIGQWHQKIALPATTFEESIDTPAGIGSLSERITSALDWDWTLSGELLAVAAPVAVDEPSAGWLHATGLLAVLAVLRRRMTLRLRCGGPT